MQDSAARRQRSLWRRSALVLAASAVLAACTRGPALTIQTPRDTVTVRLEVADTPDARALGLMYRRTLAADAGMLFVFSTAADQRFWMKNTLLPLDMIFIGANRRIVGIVADARPFSTNTLGVSAPSQYVLEVNAGFCARHGITTGDAVAFSHLPGTAQ